MQAIPMVKPLGDIRVAKNSSHHYKKLHPRFLQRLPQIGHQWVAYQLCHSYIIGTVGIVQWQHSQAQTREAVVVPVGSNSRPNSLPPYVAPPPAGSMPYTQNDRTNSAIGVQRRPSESSSESEQHSNKGSRSPSNAKGKDKRSSVFNNLFGRKQR
ncbi:BTB/POZ domain-containing protein 9 [Frankliniella fusca]|uniref:BTB/POZ domain-containing protein 9 n=1 Tax=Frankliniella fusca TaxID=407009 RepID=A0AAE1I1Q8_9NEOP|nr:BTB/POZ domain-containing protein 9 [Frankliniella fusca]